jgi:hypothetical protein
MPQNDDDGGTAAGNSAGTRAAVADAAARAAVQAALKATANGVVDAAHSALDAVERAVFGRVGGAEEQVRADAAADPLARLRQQYGVGETAPAAPPTEGPVESAEARARRQLAALKEAAAARNEATPAPDDAAPPDPIRRRTL